MATSIAEPRPEAAEAGELYRSDLYTWAQRQADALRRRDHEALDWENLHEEIEGLAAQQRIEWGSNGRQALVHMLCVQYSREGVGVGTVKGWHDEIREYRRRMAQVVARNPGLQGQFGEMFAELWLDARDVACERLGGYAAQRPESAYLFEKAAEARVPEGCPYRVEHFFPWDKKSKRIDRDVWPPGVAAVFNSVLGTEYPILSERDRDVRRQQRERRYGPGR